MLIQVLLSLIVL